MAAPGTPLSAKNASARFNTSAVSYSEFWEVDPEAALLEANSFEGGGFEADIFGLEKAQVHGRFWWDRGANPYDAPLSIQVAVTLTVNKLYMAGTSSPFWSFPLLNVNRTPHRADVKDRHMVEMFAKGSGSFLYPTGNV